MRMKKEMKMMMKKESSGSTKEPSRTSPFVLGPSGQNYDFSSGPSLFIGGAPETAAGPHNCLHCGKKLFYLFYSKREGKCNPTFVWVRSLRVTIWFVGARR